MKNQTIEQAVVETSRHFCNGIALQLKPSNAVMEAIRLLNKELPQALTAEREAGREEERANIPVSFLRQWINEDMKQPHQELVTNEDIMRFINIGYGK